MEKDLCKAQEKCTLGLESEMGALWVTDIDTTP